MSINDFEIGKEIGKGAFGSVYLVKRKNNGELYAMKQVKIIGLSKKERDNAFNEVRILSSLSHKNIIGYKEAFYDKNSETLNLVMEYADDGDLNSKIKENIKNHKYFDENIIWKTLIQILQGLKYLHKNCIIHRDLKSANIFLTKKGIIKIGDLNVSKIIKSMGMASTQTGTPYFAPPEIWNNRPYDYKCDIWSAGCIIYEMARFHVPFRAGSMRELYNNVMKGIYPPIPLKYSHELKNIIKKIIVVNPELRPSANELLNCDIIKRKIKELNLDIEYNLDLKNNNGKEHQVLNDEFNPQNNITQINKKLNKKSYDNKIKKSILLNNDYENSKINYNSLEKNEKNMKYNNIIQKIKNKKDKDKNYNNIENNKYNNNYNLNLNQKNNKLNLNDSSIKSNWNTNNFISKIFRNKIFKINNITNLINNNIIIVNNNSKVNNNSIDNNNKNYSNSKLSSDKVKNPTKKIFLFNKKNIISNDIPKSRRKINNIRNNNNLDSINQSNRFNSIKTDNNYNLDYDNNTSRGINNHIISKNNERSEIINNLTPNLLKEKEKIYYHKRLIGKRSFSSSGVKNKYNVIKSNKNISLRINIPKNGRNLKRKILKQNYSQSNIYNSSLLSIEKFNNITSINNENDNISKFKLKLDSLKNLEIKKNNLESKHKSIITAKNSFNNLIIRNNNIQIKTMNSNGNRIRNKSIFNSYHNKTDRRSNENLIKLEEKNINDFQIDTSLKYLNELNNYSLKNHSNKLRQKNKRIYFNGLQKLLNINSLDKNTVNNKDEKKEKIILSFGRRANSYRVNSCNSYTNIKNSMFKDNIKDDYNNINNISRIHHNIKEKNQIEFDQKKSKENKYFKKNFLPKPPNYLKNKIKRNNSYYGLNQNHLNIENKEYNKKSINNNIYNDLKLNFFELNDSKNISKNNYKNKYEEYYNNYKNKILINNNKYSNKNNLHKIFYDKINMNNITDREYYNEYSQLINKNEKNSYNNNNPHRSIIRNNSELSKQFSENNIQNFISDNKSNPVNNKILF